MNIKKNVRELLAADLQDIADNFEPYYDDYLLIEGIGLDDNEKQEAYDYGRKVLQEAVDRIKKWH